MPAMPRIPGKPMDIAFKILGIPANMRKVQKTEKEKEIDRRIIFQETARIR